MEQKLRGYQLQVFLGRRFSVRAAASCSHESAAFSPCTCVSHAPAHTQHRLKKNEVPLN